MRNRNLMIGVAAGAALVGASLLMPKSSKYHLRNLGSTCSDALNGLKEKFGSSSSMSNDSMSEHSGGEKLAKKSRHRAEQMLSSKINQA
ncbi:MAG: hypothetical protein IR153_05030 [Flavobacterium sp.]|nr:hypothetical protein [Flavobacterium sp.]